MLNLDMDRSPTSLRVGLYFGSFNPIHLGHLVIANHMLHEADLDEVWFVVTPSSPHKQGVELIPEQHRLQMARLAIADHPHLKAIDVEFALPSTQLTRPRPCNTCARPIPRWCSASSWGRTI